MENGKCTKDFPKKFQEVTVLESNGYPLYKRPDNGRVVMKNGVPLDNRFVVPYCPYLSLKYNAHINVEACTSVKSIKYIFKYVTVLELREVRMTSSLETRSRTMLTRGT